MFSEQKNLLKGCVIKSEIAKKKKLIKQRNKLEKNYSNTQKEYNFVKPCFRFLLLFQSLASPEKS